MATHVYITIEVILDGAAAHRAGAELRRLLGEERFNLPLKQLITNELTHVAGDWTVKLADAFDADDRSGFPVDDAEVMS